MAEELSEMPMFIEQARMAQTFRLDPITVLEERDERRRAGRLAAYMVHLDDKKRESERTKAQMKKGKSG